VVVDDRLESLQNCLLINWLRGVERQEGVQAIGKGEETEELNVAADDDGRKERHGFLFAFEDSVDGREMG
jgi:hypothetical protein